ncbi:hypothetical protein ACLKA6_000780 [Drosophila palustris]
MSRRTNFIDGNDNFREQNLRFVRNELEDNFNQFFSGGGSGAGPGAAPAIGGAPAGNGAPPRDSIVVQPTPDTELRRNVELADRRQYMRQLGVSRKQANLMAAASMNVPSFNMREIQRKRFRMSVEFGDSRQAEVDVQIVREINNLIEAREQRLQDRPRTPPPPCNINWNASRESTPNLRDIPRQREASPENYGLVRRTDDNFHVIQPHSSKGNDNLRQVERNDSIRQVERYDNFRGVERNDSIRQVERNDYFGQVERNDDFRGVERNDKVRGQRLQSIGRNDNLLQFEQHDNDREQRQSVGRNDNFHGLQRNDDFRQVDRNENFRQVERNHNFDITFAKLNQTIISDSNRFDDNFGDQQTNFGPRGPNLDGNNERFYNNARDNDNSFRRSEFPEFNAGPNFNDRYSKFSKQNSQQPPNRTVNAASKKPATATSTVVNDLAKRGNSQGKPSTDQPLVTEPTATTSSQANIINTKAPIKRQGLLPNPAAAARARLGQKRDAESVNTEQPTKKQKLAARKYVFLVGGFKLPYINKNLKELPQPEEKSYAVTFFEQTPIYNTCIYAQDNDGAGVIIDTDDDDGDDNSDDDQDGPCPNMQPVSMGKRKLGAIRKRIDKTWTKVYRLNNYKCWHTWWKAFKWCELEMNKKLEKFGNLNIKSKFLPTYPKKSTKQVIDMVMKSAHFALQENTRKHFRDSKTLYVLMNDTFLENLRYPVIEQLQNMIRGIPNHMWVYKMRSMVYLWAEYFKIASPKNGNPRDFVAIQAKWRSPVFHWLCKQSFDELKAISAIEWRFCVKTFKVNSNEKFFINVCQAPEVPAPMEVSDEELIGILESTTPGSFRVPMSISELRNTKDRSDNSVEVCDIAINPKFLDKIKRSQLFNNFFLQIVAEALSEKYNIQITMHKTIILSNRKFIGTLAAHRVRNDDVKRVEKSGDSSKQPDQISASGKMIATTLVTNVSQKTYKINSACNLTEDLGALLETKKFADVTIVTADDHKIPAHKNILSARSKVFAAMFTHSMKENTENCVDIGDFSADVIMELLRFIYTGESPNLKEMTADLIIAADKYELHRLKAMCASSLSDNLSIETAPIVLKMADLYNMEDLKSKAIRFYKN